MESSAASAAWAHALSLISGGGRSGDGSAPSRAGSPAEGQLAPHGPPDEPAGKLFSGWTMVLLVALIMLSCGVACCSPRVIKHVVDPRRGLHRYILLVLICLFIPGPYFHDAILATFKGPISEDMDLSNSQFASLFAVSSLTGVFFGPGGAVIAYVGRTRCAVVASFFAFVGSLLTTLGYHWGLLWVMLVGRFVFWFALNSLLMVQTILTYDMFKGKDLNMAMTLIVCSIRVGGSLSYPLSGPLLHRLGVMESLWFTVVLVFGAFCATLVFAKLFRGTEIARTIWPMLQSRSAKAQFSVKFLREVPRSVFFFLCALGAVWGAVFPFEVVGDDMLQTQFGYSADAAGVTIAIAPMISILSPVIGPLMGTTLPQKLRGCTLGVVCLISAFVLIALQLPLVGILMVGIGYCISICCFYSTLPMFVQTQVPEDIAGSVVSLVVGLNMVGSGLHMIVSNLAIGIIRDNSSYLWACWYLAIMGLYGLVSIAAAVALHKPRPVGEPAERQEEDPREIASEASEGSVVVTGALNITESYCTN